ncbi:pyrimidine dimer DNA glycosylase/endonuclease V [Diaphorobacter aerolatus]|uniref:DNA lyase n=1 Tax=Diaphorobacter aerolatus TaxID=1288495 RepID=A0A7H0GG44_9BURK|nr:pyrimidine dimer DNA glycosylase/endonuclease V [Diaphorobacter aerolatus]QNP47260.1 DNA lyase [Diaphorobacter aerolatus]
MRLWSLHPRYLDTKGLVALWREALLAQAVLRGETRGYRNHPQLERFSAHAAPLDAMSTYLRAVWREAEERGYSFNASKIHAPSGPVTPMPVSDGQLAYEWEHLRNKLAQRSPAVLEKWADVQVPELHPMWVLAPGPMARWERPLSPS